MTNLSDIDRELGALGAPRADVANLVARYGEQDRSLARIDDALLALGAGVTLTGLPAPNVARAVPRTPARGEAPAVQAHAPTASAVKSRARNLLDDELDPSEFPQTVPPAAPDAPAAQPATAREDATEDGFELLVEDDDILEIEDDDTQVSYERE